MNKQKSLFKKRKSEEIEVNKDIENDFKELDNKRLEEKQKKHKGKQKASGDTKLKGFSPPFLTFVIVTYFIANLTLIFIFVINFQIVVDALTSGSFRDFLILAQTNYITPAIAALLVSALDLLVIYSNFVKKKFPSVLTFVSLVYNNIICLIFFIIVYVVNMKNVYFSMQSVLTIPIITIMLSTVFMLDDYFDLMRGNYVAPIRKPKKGTLKSTELSSDIPLQHTPSEVAAADAAKLAIPTLHMSEPDSEDYVENVEAEKKESENQEKVESKEEAKSTED